MQVTIFWKETIPPGANGIQVREVVLSRYGATNVVHKRTLLMSAADLPPDQLDTLRADTWVAAVDGPPIEDAKLPEPFVGAGLGVLADPQSSWGLDRARVGSVHDRFTGTGTLVVIIDTGVNPDHQDTRDNLANFTSLLTPGAAPNDPHGHGTFVHSIAAAPSNGVGIAGAAPGAQVWHVQVFGASGSAPWTRIADAWDFVLSDIIPWAQARFLKVVVNNSYGGLTSPGETYRLAFLQTAAAVAAMVCSAGNSDGSPGQNTIGHPARWAGPGGAIPVGSTDKGAADKRSSFSSLGPELAQFGVTNGGRDVLGARHDTNDGYKFWSGTSFSAPAVAGMCCLALEAGETDLHAAIRVSCDRLGMTEPSEDRGSGYLVADKMTKIVARDAPWGGTPPAGIPYEFTSLANDPEGRLGDQHWAYGDGKTLTTRAMTHTHHFADPGDYSVSLIAEDLDGGMSQPITKTVTVVNGTPNQPPTADFTFRKVGSPPPT